MLTRSIVTPGGRTNDVSGQFFAMDVPAFAATAKRGFRQLIQYISGISRAIAAALLGIRRRFDQRRTSA
jgi:hypothetical protein